MLEKDDQISDYRLVRFLGKGQFGEVWLAEKKLQLSKKKVRHALKFLYSKGDEVDLEAAEAEIDTWIEASGHPNVMSVLDMLIYKEHIVIISEYAEAGSLRQWLKRHGGKASSNVKAIELMLGILRGVEHLHSRNVVHRDLKPDNILLQGNFPRITDFGISRIVSENATSTMAIGSPAYMSPEAFLGNKLPQTDIWSAGVILFELVTGNLPFTAESVYQLKDIIQQNEPHSLPQNVSLDLRRIIRKSLQKDCQYRFQTALEMREELETALYELAGKNKRSKSNNTNPQETISTAPTSTSSAQASDFIPDILNSQDMEQIETIQKNEVGISTLPSRVNITFWKKAEEENSQRQETQSLKAPFKTGKKLKTTVSLGIFSTVLGSVLASIGLFTCILILLLISIAALTNC
jgi:serine/threonine protein kinase